MAAARLAEGVEGADRDFYAGKVAAVRWFAATVLPKVAAERAIVVAAERAIVVAEDAAAMVLDEVAF